jgi:hypothetical protein
LILLAQTWGAQVLVLKGHVKNSGDEAIKGYYELRNSCKQLAIGHSSKLKLKLELNEIYTLIFSKPGYQSKSIVISTFADTSWWHVFKFDVTLKRLNVMADMDPEIVAGSVFYDPSISDYNYFVYTDTRKDSEKDSGKPTHPNYKIRPVLQPSTTLQSSTENTNEYVSAKN